MAKLDLKILKKNNCDSFFEIVEMKFTDELNLQEKNLVNRLNQPNIIGLQCLTRNYTFIILYF
jgi:hypothetical protein